MKKIYLPMKLILGILISGIILTFINIKLIPNSMEVFKTILGIFANSLVSTSFLVLVLQFPIIKSDIENYFVAAFSNLEFIENLNPNSVNKLIEKIIFSKYSKQYDSSFLNFYISRLPLFGQSYLSENKKDITVFCNENRYLKKIITTNEFKYKESDKMKLIDFLNKYYKNSLLLEDKNDKREIKQITLYLNDNVIFKSNTNIVNIVEESDIHNQEEAINFEKKFKLKWESLKQYNNKLEKILINFDDTIKVDISEERETSKASNIYSKRMKYLTKGFSVNLRVINEDKKVRNISGYIYGNNIKRENSLLQKQENSIRLETNHWVLPGSGYVIIIEEC